MGHVHFLGFNGFRMKILIIFGCAWLQALWRGTLAGQLLYIPYTTVQFVTLQQVLSSAFLHSLQWCVVLYEVAARTMA